MERRKREVAVALDDVQPLQALLHKGLRLGRVNLEVLHVHGLLDGHGRPVERGSEEVHVDRVLDDRGSSASGTACNSLWATSREMLLRWKFTGADFT
eukprot:8584857-Pyramimonas_sp.AAC.1